MHTASLTKGYGGNPPSGRAAFPPPRTGPFFVPANPTGSPAVTVPPVGSHRLPVRLPVRRSLRLPAHRRSRRGPGRDLPPARLPPRPAGSRPTSAPLRHGARRPRSRTQPRGTPAPPFRAPFPPRAHSPAAPPSALPVPSPPGDRSPRPRPRRGRLRHRGPPQDGRPYGRPQGQVVRFPSARRRPARPLAASPDPPLGRTSGNPATGSSDHHTDSARPLPHRRPRPRHACPFLTEGLTIT
jgi:hypothetical protein